MKSKYKQLQSKRTSESLLFIRDFSDLEDCPVKVMWDVQKFTEYHSRSFKDDKSSAKHIQCEVVPEICFIFPAFIMNWMTLQKNTWIFKPRHYRQSQGIPGDSEGKDSACNAGDQVKSLGREDPPREGNGNPLHYSCLPNVTDRGAWWTTVHEGHKESNMTKQPTFSLFTFIDHFAVSDASLNIISHI